MRRPSVDLNQQAVEFSTPSTPYPQAQDQEHNLMPNTPFLLPYHHETKEGKDEEEDRNSCFMQMQKQSIDMFWNQQLFEIYNTTVFKSNHQLPLARIKRVVKANKEVKMISAETLIAFAKACELFIQELTLRAWLQTEECKRRTLQRCDIARALRQDELLDFLKFIANNPEVPKPLMIKSSSPVAEFNYGSTSQLWKRMAEEKATEKDNKLA